MRRLSLATFVFLATLSPLFAGETGSISGVIKDSQGGVLPGASVRVSGPQLPAGREATTSQNGVYLFPRLLPGVYKVEATLQGLGTAAREVRVSVDNDAKDLPLARTYRGLFQLIPGVADNGSSIGPSAGGSRQDNTYLVDGVNITNPSFGSLSTEVNELDIVEFNIKRGAITAEFGRSAGFVANAVSKSGTNQLAGQARFQYLPKSLASKPDDPAFGDARVEQLTPAIGLGGPILKDSVFFYASAMYYKTTTPDRVNKFGTVLPDRINSGQEYYGKITATPTPKHLLTASSGTGPARPREPASAPAPRPAWRPAIRRRPRSPLPPGRSS